MITGAMSNQVNAAMVAVALRKDELEKLLAGDKLFTADLTGTMAMVRTKPNAALIVLMAETEEEMTAKIKADIELVQGHEISMDVLHPSDLKLSKETQEPEK